MEKTLKEYFRDWENEIFGYGYGSGEEFTIPALKRFLELCNEGSSKHAYEHEKLSAELTPAVAWLFINILCHADILEYGTSPRYGWLTRKGERLRAFVETHTADELYDIACDFDSNYCHCSRDYCNCGETSTEGACDNPFWKDIRTI